MEEGEKESKRKPSKVIRNPGEWRPFVTSTAKCNCGKFSLQDLPQLERILPEDYEYKLCDFEELGSPEKFIVTLRMNLGSKDEALKWKRSFEEKSLTTHSVVQVYSKVSLKRVFKGMYKCKFNQPWREKRPRKRNPQFEVTDCPSALNIVIKNFAKSGRIRASDPHLPDYATLIRIRFAHNHDIAAPRSLQKRPLCPEIEKRFEEMFRQGIKPKDALDKHKRDLQQQLGMEHYMSVAVDGFYVPDKNKVYRMYTKVMGKTSAKTTTKRVSKHNPDADMIAFDYCALTGKSTTAAEDEEDNNNGGIEDDDNDIGKDILIPVTNVEVSNNTTAEGPVCGTMTASSIMAPDRRAETGDLQVFDALMPETTHGLGPPPPAAIPEEVAISQGMGMIYETGPVQNTAIIHGSPLIPNMGAPVLTLQNMGTHSFEYHSQANQQHRQTHQMAAPSNFGQINHLAPPNMANGNLSIHPGTSSCAVQQNATIQSLNHQNFATGHYNIVANIGYQPATSQGILSQNMMGQNTLIQNTFPPQHQQAPPPNQVPHNLTVQNIGQQYQPPPTFRPMPQENQNNRPQSQTWLSHKGATIPCQPAIMARKSIGSKLIAQKKRFQNLSNLKTVGKKKLSKTPKNEFRANSFRKTLLKKTPRVDPATHSSAFQAVQNMLLIDESKRLNERFSRFCADLEEKMKSNPKLFVPGVRNLMNTWQDLRDDEEKAAALKDFGKLEEKVIEEQKRKRLDNMKDKGVQAVILPPQKTNSEPVLLVPVDKVVPGEKMFLLPTGKISTRVMSSKSTMRKACGENLILVQAGTKIPGKRKSLLLKSTKSRSKTSLSKSKSHKSSIARSKRSKKNSQKNSEILKRLRAPPRPVSEIKKELTANAGPISATRATPVFTMDVNSGSNDVYSPLERTSLACVSPASQDDVAVCSNNTQTEASHLTREVDGTTGLSRFSPLEYSPLKRKKSGKTASSKKDHDKNVIRISVQKLNNTSSRYSGSEVGEKPSNSMEETRCNSYERSHFKN